MTLHARFQEEEIARGYKVLYLADNGWRVSATAICHRSDRATRDHHVRYIMGRWAEPPFGYLFAFGELRDAIIFAENLAPITHAAGLQIWECDLILAPRPWPRKILNVLRVPEFGNLFWNDYLPNNDDLFEKVPHGTLFCTKVRITQRAF